MLIHTSWKQMSIGASNWIDQFCQGKTCLTDLGSLSGSHWSKYGRQQLQLRLTGFLTCQCILRVECESLKVSVSLTHIHRVRPNHLHCECWEVTTQQSWGFQNGVWRPLDGVNTQLDDFSLGTKTRTLIWHQITNHVMWNSINSGRWEVSCRLSHSMPIKQK